MPVFDIEVEVVFHALLPVFVEFPSNHPLKGMNDQHVVADGICDALALGAEGVIPGR